MPEPEQPTPEGRRFERIEAAHEFLTGIVAGIAVTQEKIGEAQLRTEFALAQTGQQMKQLAAAQTSSEGRIEALAAMNAIRAAEHDDLKDKLHVLYDDVDKWIREHGAKNGAAPPHRRLAQGRRKKKAARLNSHSRARLPAPVARRRPAQEVWPPGISARKRPRLRISPRAAGRNIFPFRGADGGRNRYR